MIYFLILTELTSFLLSFVLWSFLVLGKDSIDYGIRSGKNLSLGMPKAPQGNIQGCQEPKLGDALGTHPLFRLHLSVTLLEAIFLFTTWHVFCLERLVWFESLLFSLPQSSFLYTPFWERHTWFRNYWNTLCASLISFELGNFALVLHLYLFRARWWFYL